MAAYRESLAAHFPDAEFGVSERPGHEYLLADRALAEGHTRIIAVGGDGTWSHVADRVMASGRQDVVLGLLPAGTGNDFGRNLGIDYRNPTEAVARLVGGSPRPVDIGRVRTPSRPAEAGKEESDGERVRHFLNVVGVGFDVAVVEAAAGARFLRGELLYKITALQQLFRFRGLPLVLSASSGLRREGDHLMVTVTNGAYFGGGFPISPSARVDDGLLHACILADAAPLRRLALFNRAEKGRHVDQKEVLMDSGTRYGMDFGGPVRFEVDGDLFETSESVLELEILPGALKVLIA